MGRAVASMLAIAHALKSVMGIIVSAAVYLVLAKMRLTAVSGLVVHR